MCSLANSEDPHAMLHNASFHQGLHCLLRQSDLQIKKYNFQFEIVTCDPSKHTMDHPKGLLYQTRRKNESISTLRVKSVPV